MSKQPEKITSSTEKTINQKDNYHPDDLGNGNVHTDLPPITTVIINSDDPPHDEAELDSNTTIVRNVEFHFEVDPGKEDDFLPVIIQILNPNGENRNTVVFNPNVAGNKLRATCKKVSIVNGFKYYCAYVPDTDGRKQERVVSKVNAFLTWGNDKKYKNIITLAIKK